jgi:hypothetical protein
MKMKRPLLGLLLALGSVSAYAQCANEDIPGTWFLFGIRFPGTASPPDDVITPFRCKLVFDDSNNIVVDQSFCRLGRVCKLTMDPRHSSIRLFRKAASELLCKHALVDGTALDLPSGGPLNVNSACRVLGTFDFLQDGQLTIRGQLSTDETTFHAVARAIDDEGGEIKTWQFDAVKRPAPQQPQ